MAADVILDKIIIIKFNTIWDVWPFLQYWTPTLFIYFS